MNPTEGVYIYNRSSFIELEDYEKEVYNTTRNLLGDLLRRIFLTTDDLLDISTIKRYQIGKDTFLKDKERNSIDFTSKLEEYHAYGIKVLLVETTKDYTKIIIPSKEPKYNKSIGEVGDINYTPSTYDFINSYKPQSGYKK